MVGEGDRFVSDGRVDAEKLNELRQVGAEVEGLEFKTSLDLRDPRHEIDHVKDLLALMSLPAGGYIIVGTHESGALATDHPPIEPRLFDQAVLQKKVQAYTHDQIELRSAVHSVPRGDGLGDWNVAIVYAGPPPGTFPIVVTKQGEFTKPAGGQQVVFRVGQIIMREGTTTTELASRFWERLLTRYAEKVREDTRRDVDALVRRVVEMLEPGDGPNGGRQRILIDFKMDIATFEEASAALIESASQSQLDRVLTPVSGLLTEAATEGAEGAVHDLLDRLFSLATTAMLYGDSAQFQAVIDTVREYYDSISPLSEYVSRFNQPGQKQSAAAWRDVVVRLYVLGSLAVRKKKWWHLHQIAAQPYAVTAQYQYASWLRHGLTYAARAEVLDDQPNRGGALISRARSLAIAVPQLRPDLHLVNDSDIGGDLPADPLMNSLCQFDILWCIVAQATTNRPGAEDFYPSSSAFHQWRLDPALIQIATDTSMRHELLPSSTDQQAAAAIREVYDAAKRESWKYGGWWSELPPDAAQFVALSGGSA